MSRDVPTKLNICWVTKKFPVPGLSQEPSLLWPIAKGLSELGHKVTIISWKNPHNKKELNQSGIQIHYLGESFARSERDFPFLAKQKFQQLHSRDPFHVVHSWEASGIEIAKMKSEYNVVVTFGVEATEMSQLYSILAMTMDKPGSLIKASFAILYKFLRTYLEKDRGLLNHADGVFVTSPQQKLILERHYLYPDLKTFIIPFGIEVQPQNSHQNQTKQLKEELKIPEDCLTLFTHSDMREVGELKSLLRAFEQTAIKHPRVRLLISGDGPAFKEIEYEMLMLALSNRASLLGEKSSDQISELISLCDIFVNLSSRTSGFDPLIVEAMAKRKLIIGSELSPISTIVDNGINGFLIRPADVNSLEQLLNDILGGDVDTSSLGEKASQKIQNIFNTNKMVDQTLQAYKTTLENSGLYGSKWKSLIVNAMR